MASIAMYGKGRVGKSVVSLGKSVGLDITLFDDTDTNFDPSDYDIIIPTPGVCPSNRAFAACNTLAELDFAASFLPTGWQIFAVTGTDGKSTTCSILAQILSDAYGVDRVYLSGNFEIPLSETVAEIRSRNTAPGYLVVEVSSFMAHELGHTELLRKIPGSVGKGFTPDMSIFTNIAPDHLNWHGDLQSYYQAKYRLFTHSKKSIVHDQIYNFARIHQLPTDFPEVRIFGESPHLLDRLTSEGEIIISGEKTYTPKDISLPGTHNALNILASSIVADELKISLDTIRIALSKLRALPHRLELVCKKKWVSYIDDSKSTSAQSLRAALGSFREGSIHLIAGGSDKWDEFLSLAPLLKSQCLSIIGIGATREQFRQVAALAHIPFDTAETMAEAVQKAASLAQIGEIVLLSPGCASFGLFRDYLDRAEQFKTHVSSLPDHA